MTLNEIIVAMRQLAQKEIERGEFTPLLSMLVDVIDSYEGDIR